MKNEDTKHSLTVDASTIVWSDTTAHDFGFIEASSGVYCIQHSSTGLFLSVNASGNVITTTDCSSTFTLYPFEWVNRSWYYYNFVNVQNDSHHLAIADSSSSSTYVLSEKLTLWQVYKNYTIEDRYAIFNQATNTFLSVSNNELFIGSSYDDWFFV